MYFIMDKHLHRIITFKTSTSFNKYFGKHYILCPYRLTNGFHFQIKGWRRCFLVNVYPDSYQYLTQGYVFLKSVRTTIQIKNWEQKATCCASADAVIHVMHRGILCKNKCDIIKIEINARSATIRSIA